MFTKILKATALAALIATGATAATTSQASAGQVEFGITFGTPGYGPGPHWGPTHGWGPRHGWGARRGVCPQYRAVNKARQFGVRNPRIVNRTPHRVVVHGWRHGHQSRVIFANQRYCPVIRAY